LHSNDPAAAGQVGHPSEAFWWMPNLSVFFALSIRMLLLAFAVDKDYNDFEEIGIKVRGKSDERTAANSRHRAEDGGYSCFIGYKYNR
jgi:hypothetical protein